MKKLFKITTAIMTSLLIASMGAVLSVSATDYTNPTDQYGNPYNPNTRDTQWNASSIASNRDCCRPKFNSSSIYVKNYSTTHNAKVDVYGRSSLYGSDFYVNIPNHSTLNLTLPANSTRTIYQGIHEKGYTFAHVYFNDADTAEGAAYGVWSPDSTGSFTAIN